MENKLLQGNCLNLMEQVPRKSIDLILCDLPYGQTRNKWDVKLPLGPLWQHYLRIIKDNGAILLFANQPFTSELVLSNPKMFRYSLVWDKKNPSGFLNAKKMPLRYHEDILVFYKKTPVYNPQKTTGHTRKVVKRIKTTHSTNYGKQIDTLYDSTERFPRSILPFAKDSHRLKLNPTQKPVALLEYLIRTYTGPGAMVLDNCMGSGSTGVAAVKTGRRFIGMEKDREMFEKAKQWFEKSYIECVDGRVG